MAFHSKDGWYWERTTDGSVRTTWRRADGTVVAEHVIDASGWASIVSSVSAGGEVDGRFYAAGDFHASHGPVEIKAK